MIIYKMNILIEMIIIKLKNMKIRLIIYKKIQNQNNNNKIIILNKDNMIIIENIHNMDDLVSKTGISFDFIL